MSPSKTISLMLLFIMVATTPFITANAAISCGQVISYLGPCISYLQTGGEPSTVCCKGVSTLNDMAQSTPDRQQACQCLKSASTTISGINPDNASGLPGKCGVSIPYKISTSTDCASVK